MERGVEMEHLGQAGAGMCAGQVRPGTGKGGPSRLLRTALGGVGTVCVGAETEAG